MMHWKKLRASAAVLAHAARRFDDHDGTFLAAGLAFNMMLCLLPFVLVLAALLATVLESSQAVQQEILAFFERAVPAAAAGVQQTLWRFLNDRELIGLMGLVFLLLAASRLFASVRVIMRTCFGLESQFSFITGKIFDIIMVLLTAVLLLASVALASLLTILQEWGGSRLALEGRTLGWVEGAMGAILGFVLSVCMFFVLYRMPLPWRVSSRLLLGVAVLVSVFWELAKRLFGFYLANLSNFDVLYGSFGIVVALVLWVYYTALIFVAGAEVGAAVLALRREG